MLLHLFWGLWFRETTAIFLDTHGGARVDSSQDIASVEPSARHGESGWLCHTGALGNETHMLLKRCAVTDLRGSFSLLVCYSMLTSHAG